MSRTRAKRRKQAKSPRAQRERSPGAPADAGHAVHFLERVDERVGGEAEELALQLYHKPDAVRAMLAELALPDEVERVALALAPGGGPGPSVQGPLGAGDPLRLLRDLPRGHLCRHLS